MYREEDAGESSGRTGRGRRGTVWTSGKGRVELGRGRAGEKSSGCVCVCVKERVKSITNFVILGEEVGPGQRCYVLCICDEACCIVLQCVAVCCSVLKF